MREAGKEYGWNLNNAGIAQMWRGGCIIKSVFLADITTAFQKDQKLESLLFDDFFKSAIEKASPGWRRVVAQSTLWGIPIPAHSTALSFFDGYRTEVLPAVSLAVGGRYLNGLLTDSCVHTNAEPHSSPAGLLRVRMGPFKPFQTSC